MTGPSPRGAAPSPPHRPPRGAIDVQILATWRALLANPDLDAVHARRAIDQLLDRRASPVNGPTVPASPLNRRLSAGTPAPHSVIAEVLTILLAGLESAAASVPAGRRRSWHDGWMDLNVPLKVIGVVRTGYAELEATPIQARLNRAERGTIEIAGRYQEGLDGLAEFDYAWLVTWLHRLAEPGSDPPLRHVPFLLRSRQRTKGIFATRGPKRVNPIGLSLVRLLDVSGPLIRFAGVDLVDGTPVIDLKPYVTRFDRPAGDPRCGWFDQVTITDGITPAQLARARRQPHPPIG